MKIHGAFPASRASDSVAGFPPRSFLVLGYFLATGLAVGSLQAQPAADEASGAPNSSSSLRSSGRLPIESLKSLADICLRLGHLDKAEGIMSRASAYVDGEYLSGRPLAADHLTVRGQFLAMKGQDEEANRVLGHANKIREELLAAGGLSLSASERYRQALLLQAEVLDRLDRAKEARILQRRAGKLQTEKNSRQTRSLAIQASEGGGSEVRPTDKHLPSSRRGGADILEPRRFSGEEW